MHFEDKFEVNASVETVWKFVTNPDDFAKIIPDLQSYEIIDEKQFKASFKIGLGMIKGTLNMTFKFEDMEPMTRVKVVGRGSGMQSTADLTINLNLQPSDGKTVVSWSADLNVGGLVASVGARLLESTTKKKVTEIVEGIRKVIEGKPTKKAKK